MQQHDIVEKFNTFSGQCRIKFIGFVKVHEILVNICKHITFTDIDN